jgi:predicted RNA-binding Zn-ribbon protein involved in translation (DUF1610 family)/outer membrane protein assembly factor BamB
MWIRLQVTARCVACSELTAVNAAVTALSCNGCGAALSVRDELWRNALADVGVAARALDGNATKTQTLDAEGMALSIAAAAVTPRCPHCDVEWSVGEPSTTCVSCGIAVSVRAFGPGTLVGEDALLLAGARRESTAVSVACTGCGAPLAADGSKRNLACENCGRETIVADDVWRRLHAPTAVASWFLRTDDDAYQGGLRHRLSPSSLAAGDGRLFVLGRYGDTPFALLALNLDPLSVAWMVDLATTTPNCTRLSAISFRGGELLAWQLMGRSVEIFNATTGAHRTTVPTPEPLLDMVADDDDSFLCRSPTGDLFRVDEKGAALPVWGHRGLFSRLFSGGAARRVENSGARLGAGHDGDLRFAEGSALTRIGRDGALRWRVEVKDAQHIPDVPPGAAADGTSWAVFRTGQPRSSEEFLLHSEAMLAGRPPSTSMLVRVSADGEAVNVVRRSPGASDFASLAVTPDGGVWVSTRDGLVLRLDAEGAILWQQQTRD